MSGILLAFFLVSNNEVEKISSFLFSIQYFFFIRIETIIDCDRVLVMNNGRVGEFAPPKDLLSDHESIFYSLVRESVERKTTPSTTNSW